MPRQPLDRALQRHSPRDADRLPRPGPQALGQVARKRRTDRHVVVVGLAMSRRHECLLHAEPGLQLLLELDPRQEGQFDLHFHHAERLGPLDSLVHPEPGDAKRCGDLGLRHLVNVVVPADLAHEDVVLVVRVQKHAPGPSRVWRRPRCLLAFRTMPEIHLHRNRYR